MLIRAFCSANALTTHTQPRVIHHSEHRPHTVMRRANQPAGCPVILHHRCRAAMQAHFMFQAYNLQSIGHPGVSVAVRD